MDFEILSVSSLFARIAVDPNLSHKPTLPHRISFFALLFVTKGAGRHQIDLENYTVEAGTVLKISKGQIHAFQENPCYEGFLILFTETFVLNYFSRSSVNLISHLYNYHLSNPVVQNKKLNQSFLEELLLELENQNQYAQKNIIAALLNLYLLRLERTLPHPKLEEKNPKNYNTFLQFKNLVESNYTQTRNVKDYAELLHISTKQLNTIVKEYTFIPSKSFIDNYIILEIKRAIVTTDKSFKEIAYEIGFDEVTNFTKFFKNKMKLSPKEFRLKH